MYLHYYSELLKLLIYIYRCWVLDLLLCLSLLQTISQRHKVFQPSYNYWKAKPDWKQNSFSSCNTH